ncbi:hypothetical protein U8V72_22330 [Priestia filamentosa]|uniref:hypothetical protein n=1 Tax=Priestia filamentosa TaxID=1402861 RepID=UPI000589155E
MKRERKENLQEIESILSKSKADVEEVDVILKKIKREIFAEYRTGFKQDNRTTEDLRKISM